MKKSHTVTLIAFFLLAFLCTGFIVGTNYAKHIEEKRATELFRQESREMYLKASYATEFAFESNVVVSPYEPDAVTLEIFPNGVRFVTSKPNYFELGELVYWPSIITDKILKEINEAIIEDELSLEKFGMAYPLTIGDVVYNDKAVIEFLLHELDQSRNSVIFH